MNNPSDMLNNSLLQHAFKDAAEFERIPFRIRAVVLTETNFAELAECIGEARVTSAGRQYIAIPRARAKSAPNQHAPKGVFRAYVGEYITWNGEQVRVFSKEAFRQAFQMVPSSGQRSAVDAYTEAFRQSFLATDGSRPRVSVTNNTEAND